MKIIISGGGGQLQNPDAHRLFVDSVDKSKPILYLCFALWPSAKNEAYSRFALNMANQGVYSTRLCADASFFDKFSLEDFGGIYCAGGNTFRLLKQLKECKADIKIKKYLENGGVYMGGSAGAIIVGYDIMPIIYMDSNAVLLKDTRGLNMMNGWSTIAHYGNASTDDKNAEWNEAVETLAKDYHKLIALSEQCAVIVEDDRMYMLGSDCLVYENGIPRIIANGETFV